MRRSLLSWTMIAILAASALADIPPPPPEKGFKQVPREHVVKLGGEIPGYKFYTFEQYGLNGDISVKELSLSKDQGVVVPSTYSGSAWVGVLAVPQKIVDQEKTPENVAKLLSRFGDKKLPAGCALHETSGTSVDLPDNDPRKKVEEVITISTDEKLGVKFTVKEPSAAKKTDGGESSAVPPTATLFAGAALSMALVTSGLLWFRRMPA